MTKVLKRSNKATLIAAALIVTGATAIFGTYAAETEPAPQFGPGPLACYQMMNQLTEEQRAALEEAKALFEAGEKEAAIAILEEAGVKPPRREHREERRDEFIENLTLRGLTYLSVTAWQKFC